ncbi:MAG: GAP family protein [Acidimicrobiales bacterium]
MKAVIGDILPLALVVTISPINIIAAILLLFSRRPLLNASSYFVGFVLGVAAVLAGFVAIAGALNLTAGSDTSRGAAGVMLVLGVALLVAAVRKFRGRPRSGEEPSTPKWMDGIAGYSAARSFVVGVAVGAFNPKNLVVGLAAAVAVGSAGLSIAAQIGATTVYVVVAVLGVAAPIVTMVVLGEKAQPVLDKWRLWLDENNAVVMAVLFVIFGVVLVGKGIAGL